ncbi:MULTISPECIES: hypothetical protein [Neisseria]|nr:MULTISPECIES: hypothetical protein [Neisseria]MDU4437856.1 hypothetical protein [Neisseria sp.]
MPDTQAKQQTKSLIFQTTLSHPAYTELKIYNGLNLNQYGVASP